MEKISVLLPDRSRASLAPYLPIPYGTRKLLLVVVPLLFSAVTPVCGVVWDWALFTTALLGASFLLIALDGLHDMRREKKDFSATWWATYLDRNWHGYTLWIYKLARPDARLQDTVGQEPGRSGGVHDEVRYRILRKGASPTSSHLDFSDRAKVMISIPLSGVRRAPSVRASVNFREPNKPL